MFLKLCFLEHYEKLIYWVSWEIGTHISPSITELQSMLQGYLGAEQSLSLLPHTHTHTHTHTNRQTPSEQLPGAG